MRNICLRSLIIICTGYDVLSLTLPINNFFSELQQNIKIEMNLPYWANNSGGGHEQQK